MYFRITSLYLYLCKQPVIDWWIEIILIQFKIQFILCFMPQSFISLVMRLAIDTQLLITKEQQSTKYHTQWTNPCCFIQAGAGNSDVCHGHVINRLLCSRDTALLLQAVQHHQRTHHSAAKLHDRKQKVKKRTITHNGNVLSVPLYQSMTQTFLQCRKAGEVKLLNTNRDLSFWSICKTASSLIFFTYFSDCSSKMACIK